MIKIDIFQTTWRYGIRITGHAGYGTEGNDIVCAGVSVLVQTLGNYIEAHKDELNCNILEMRFEKGDSNIQLCDTSISGSMNYILKAVFDMTADGLEDLAIQYPEYIIVSRR